VTEVAVDGLAQLRERHGQGVTLFGASTLPSFHASDVKATCHAL